MSNISVEVQIETNDGTNKNYAKFALDETTELERVVIVQGIFKIMGIDNQMSEMVDDYVKLGKAYNNFYSTVSNEEPIETLTEANPISPIDTITTHIEAESIIKQYVEAAITEANKIDEIIPDSKTENPDHYKTGIRESPSGNRYQCRMHCDQCKTNKTIYIKPNELRIYCKMCGKPHTVRSAKKEKMQQDAMNNFFIAGSFVGEDEKMEDSNETIK